MNDRDRAKQIVIEILRTAGKRLPSKTRIFKAFYFAHLFFAQRSPGFLSDWPVVKMRRGPGIMDGDRILEELVREGLVEVRTIHDPATGPFPAQEYVLKTEVMPDLDLNAVEAIRDAVTFVQNKSVSELTELTHEYSRSWNSANEIGDELNIYVDLVDDQEFAELQQSLKETESVYQSVFGAD